MCEPKLKHAQSVLTSKVLSIVHASHTQTHVLKPNSLTIVEWTSPQRCTISTDHKSVLNCAYFFFYTLYIMNGIIGSVCLVFAQSLSRCFTSCYRNRKRRQSYGEDLNETTHEKEIASEPEP